MDNLKSLGLIPLVGLMAVLQLASAEDVPKATIHVQVFGAFGEKVTNPVLHLYTIDRKQELEKAWQDSTIVGVPFGRYVLLAYAGSGVGEREVTVNTKEAWVRLGLAFPAGERAWPPGDLTISGDIKPPPGSSQKEWWVRVEGVFLHEIREAPIQGSGHFSVPGLWIGKYLVEVFEGSKLRHVEAVDMDTKEPNVNLMISLTGQESH
jgi:hypothetical protein